MAQASILVVDDETDVRELLSTVLARHGYEVYEADSGDAALKALGERAFDLVLLDLVMPDMSGIEVLARIRSHYPMAALPVVILTAHASNESILHALEIGANEFLVKPLSMPLILGRIEAQVGLKRTVEDLRKAETQVRDTLNAIPDIIFRADAGGTILDTTPGHVTEAEWIGRMLPDATLMGVLPATMEQAFFEFAAVGHPEGHIHTGRFSVPQHDGKSTVFEMRMVACSHDETVCIVRDVTEQARFEHELIQLARTDALTQIANRRQFDEVLLTEWRRAVRHQTSLSVILVDIDFFKLFNDSQGHQAGDECLRAVARTLSKALLRAGDFLARYGGEEFAIVVPNTDLAGAERVAERLRAAIEGLQLPHPQSPQGCVTISAGVGACRPTKAHDLATLVRIADEALYEAKRAGRNRAVCRNYSDELFEADA